MLPNMSPRLIPVVAFAILLAGCRGTTAPASSTPASGVASTPGSAAASKPAAATSTAAKPSGVASASAAAKPASSTAAKPAASGAGEAQPAGSAATASTPPGSAEHGKDVYVKVGCYECHGYAGQGAQATGPKLAPNPLPYVAFAAQVRTPRQDMPKYPTQTVSDQDLADIYAFVQAIPAPPSPQSIPLLNNR